MELTISIKEQAKIDFFMNLLGEFDYVEILNIKEHTDSFAEHKKLLDARLDRIERGEGTFKSWDEIRKKYEKTT